MISKINSIIFAKYYMKDPMVIDNNKRALEYH